jgi:WD40 repeat protein
MWAAWSPDDKHIATASWDEHYRIWDTTTGECKHIIGPTDEQNWTGAFSPDSKHVLLSGGRPVKVAIYDIETGDEIKTLKQENLKLDSWMRYLSWNPNGADIALINGKSVIIWQPFDNKVEKVFELKRDDTMLTRFNDVGLIKWTDHGDRLILQDSEDTTFVWDREKNVKWRFQRPYGTALEGNSDALYISSKQMMLMLDGDGMVRFWDLSNKSEKRTAQKDALPGQRALQDYQTQLKLLEKQNQKRLPIADEDDSDV